MVGPPWRQRPWPDAASGIAIGPAGGIVAVDSETTNAAGSDGWLIPTVRGSRQPR